MLNNLPPLKRQKNDNDIIGKCLYCNGQPLDDPCAHCSSSQSLVTECQQLLDRVEDPKLDMEDIERRLRKLEARISTRLREDTPTCTSFPSDSHLKSNDHTNITNDNRNNNNNSDNIASSSPTLSSSTDQRKIEPRISLTPTGIHITTSLTESHHFVKLLVRGVNPTFVREKAAQVYSRHIDMVGPSHDNAGSSYHGISNLAIDKETPEELMWLDMVLTTRYPRCFLVYQMVEKDRLVEWVSHAFIEGRRGQAKLEHSLLAKSVRAFVYNHEKVSYHREHGDGAGPVGLTSNDDSLHRAINPNRGAFYFQQAEELLELCYMSSSRITIRALLHMYMYQIMTPGGHIKAVQYSDLAIRMAQSLKLNQERGVLVNEQIREDDRRLWWSTFWIHVWSCLAFDRPLLVEVSSMNNSRPPSRRPNESNDVGYCVDFCVHSVKLMILTVLIGQRLKAKTTETKLLWELQDIEHQLDAWSSSLPEVLHPRFWNNTNNNGDLHQHPELVDDIVYHGQRHALSSLAFGVEVGLLLQGQWAMTKMQVYECFNTNDASILDLLIVRNRLQVALDYTNFLARSVERARPCLVMYLLTGTESSLVTLFETTEYPHSPDLMNQALQQLIMLKNVFGRFPFSEDFTAKKWVQDIDRALSKHPQGQYQHHNHLQHHHHGHNHQQQQESQQSSYNHKQHQQQSFQTNTNITMPHWSIPLPTSDINGSSIISSEHYSRDELPYSSSSFTDKNYTINDNMQSSYFIDPRPSTATLPSIPSQTSNLTQLQKQRQQEQQGWITATPVPGAHDIYLTYNSIGDDMSQNSSMHHQTQYQPQTSSSARYYSSHIPSSVASSSDTSHYRHHHNNNNSSNKNNNNNNNNDSGLSYVEQQSSPQSSIPTSLSTSSNVYYQHRYHAAPSLSQEQEPRSEKSLGKQPSWSSPPDILDPSSQHYLNYPPTD